VRLASISIRGLGRVATQTLMFLSAGIAGPAAVGQRLRDAWAGLAAGDHRVFAAGPDGHDG